MSYIYYCVYLAVTFKNKKPGKHDRAYLVFAVGLTLHISAILIDFGLVHSVKHGIAITPLLIIAGSFGLSRLFLYGNDRNIKIVEHYESVNPGSNGWRIFVGIMWFVTAVISFSFSRVFHPLT